MSETVHRADLLSGMSDPRLRLEETLGHVRFYMVSNNLGVYFLFCLFVLAILAIGPTCR